MYEELKNGGERTAGETIWHCTKDQLWRYVEALDYISKEDKVVDIGCGCGYGSMILGHKANIVIGIDNYDKIINFANKFYRKNNVSFLYNDLNDISVIFDKKYFDVIVACEFIEHIENTEYLFETMDKIVKKRIILTTPHTSVINNNKFHYRHFNEEDIKRLFNKINFKILKMCIMRFAGGNAIFCVGERND